MLDKVHVYKLIEHRIWMLITRTSSVSYPMAITLDGGDKDSIEAFFAVVFHENGRLEIPTKVGFIPNEYGSWDFDENTQEIIFVNSKDQSEIRASLPEPLPYGDNVIAIKLKNGSPDSTAETLFVNAPHLNHPKITHQQISSRQVLLVPRKEFSFSLYKKLRWSGISVKLVDCEQGLLSFLHEAYEYLANHPRIENIVISRKNRLFIKFAQGYQLAFLNNQGLVSFDYLSGSRQVVMEFLIVVLTENNLRLFDEANSRDEETMLQDILNKQFYQRYKLINFPNP
ncbi:hypothetical protein GBP13_04445 [Pediococcus acidilactici]|uniref:hypothetical protein n=1 Tax=Pediococcus acidilactici TaxID=1254 RepID=UPI001329E188|nr:hypothetical protein [Pediococcus acidilactici]KAF0364419.1 hypothetical protein GBO50_04440 [Pediococcus acidilactici]KAF0368496.1 hypothetical protein GBO55_05140 [Pediococcus acidilactici]KAF0420189.1 hypothetical protein GBO80_01565 [Pediococcus acidilactici]KAF0424375.1 hypothetical protein GBO82_01565 [Pediococcus acidilactici]KAF0474469.1 hypothetical protein GBP08_04445 [Pediococcus acidilactici]